MRWFHLGNSPGLGRRAIGQNIIPALGGLAGIGRGMRTAHSRAHTLCFTKLENVTPVED